MPSPPRTYVELDREAQVVRGTFAGVFTGDTRTGTRHLPATEVRAGARHLRDQQYAPHTPSGAVLTLYTPYAPAPVSENGT